MLACCRKEQVIVIDTQMFLTVINSIYIRRVRIRIRLHVNANQFVGIHSEQRKTEMLNLRECVCNHALSTIVYLLNESMLIRCVFYIIQTLHN